MRAYFLIIALAVFILGLTGAYIGVYEFYRAPQDISAAKPDYKVSATDLLNEFKKDESSASAKFINKIIEVNGNVASITEAGNNQTNISLKTGNDMSSVICTLKTDHAGGIKEGDTITIRGECSGFLMDVLLNNCAIVK